MDRKYLSIQKTCESELRLKTLVSKEQQVLEAYNEMKKKFALYPMDRCFDRFFDRLFEDLLFLGIQYACKTQDMSYMLNGIFQASRIEMIRQNWVQGGRDHSDNLVGIVLAFAANDLPLIDKMTPPHLGLSTNGYYKSQYNMVYALHRKNEELGKIAERQLLDFLTKKHSKFDRDFSRYLLEVHRGNVKGISDGLQELCNSIAKVNWVQDDIFGSVCYYKLGRCVALFVHGLYHLAYDYLEPEEFFQIKIPEHKTFLEDYERFHREKGFLAGNNLIPFESTNRFMAHCTDLDIIPEVSVYTDPLDKKRYIDIPLFQKTYMDNLKSHRILSYRMEGDNYVFQSIS